MEVGFAVDVDAGALGTTPVGDIEVAQLEDRRDSAGKRAAEMEAERQRLEAEVRARFPDVPFLWLDFTHGGDGVFLLTADQLAEFRDLFCDT